MHNFPLFYIPIPIFFLKFAMDYRITLCQKMNPVGRVLQGCKDKVACAVPSVVESYVRMLHEVGYGWER